METLPTAIVNWVGAFLPLQDVHSLALTCKRNHFCMLPHFRVAFAKRFVLPLWYDEKEAKLKYHIIGERFIQVYGQVFNVYGERQPAFFSHPEIAKIFLVQHQQEARQRVSRQVSCRVSLTEYGLELVQEVRCLEKQYLPSQHDRSTSVPTTSKKASNIGINRAKRAKKRAANELSSQHNKKQRLYIHDLPKTIITPEVFEKLEPLDLSSASRVCKQWRDFSDVHLWKPRLVKRWQFSFMSRDLPVSTPLVLVDGFTSYREACISDKTRLYFGQNNGQPEILVHQKPLNQSWGQ